MTRSFRLVANPNAGAGKALELAQECRKRMREAGIEEALDGHDTVILLGGDGTIHEYLNDSEYDTSVALCVVPCGTANALYASYYAEKSKDDKWSSLEAALRGHQSSLKPVALAHVAQKTACVIVSAALHASILYDSETLRKSHPGVERFKIAAMQNINRLYPCRLKLSGQVRRYTPAQRAFVACETVDITDDMSYLLLGALTDRLEPTFVVAPLRHTDTSPGLDVVIVRKSRRPPSEQPFAEVLGGAVTAGMYDGGKHIDLVYAPEVRAWKEGDADSLNTVVEYYRCQQVEWTPRSASDDTDPRSRLLCIDGALKEIPSGQTAYITAQDTLPNIWI